MAASVDIPKQHQAAVYDKPGTNSIKLENVDTPAPGPGEVLIKLSHSGVCHSDYGVMMNSWRHLPFPTQANQVGGHEGVGKVVALGPATENKGIKVGDRVGIKWVAGICNNCQPCREGQDGCCVACRVSGYYTPGTFQQYVLGPADYVTPIPDALPSADAAPLLCAGVTVYSALKKTNCLPGEWVVISGAGGGLGHIACQVAKNGFGFRVIGVDAGEKKELALKSGAEHFLNIFDYKEDEAIAEAVRKLTGRDGAKAAVVCTANNRAYAQAMLMLGYRGTLVCVGMPEGDSQPIATSYPQLMVFKILTIVGSAVGNRQDAIETMEWASRGIMSTSYRLEKIDKLQEIFNEMAEQKLQGRVVLEFDQD